MQHKILLFLVLFCSACVTYAAPIKNINFATEATYPPFESITPSGEIKGLDIDIAKVLCKEIGATCSFVNQPFDSLITSLKLGKFDAIIAAMEITPERQKEVAFTAPYLSQNVNFIAPVNSSLTTINATTLKGKTIGVQAGTSFEQYLRTTYKNSITVNTYASIATAFIDLEAGRIDAILGDTMVIAEWLKQQDPAITKKFHLIGKPIDDPLFKGGDGIAVKKENAELLKALNNALQKIKTNGELDKIKQQYLVTGES